MSCLLHHVAGVVTEKGMEEERRIELQPPVDLTAETLDALLVVWNGNNEGSGEAVVVSHSLSAPCFPVTLTAAGAVAGGGHLRPAAHAGPCGHPAAA